MIVKVSKGVKSKQHHRGINRAEVHQGFHHTLVESKEILNKKGICVFISHRSTDKIEAAVIAEYIKNCGIDVYIDVDDKGLQIATIKNDAHSIVNYIHNGISQSTHILVLISDDTRESWWVPYEIGYGEKSGKKIASMMIEQDDVDAFPDYLKIVKRLFSVEDFIDYMKGLKRSQNRNVMLTENTYFNDLPDEAKISKYIKKVEIV